MQLSGPCLPAGPHPLAKRSGYRLSLPSPPSALHLRAAVVSFASAVGWKVRLMVLGLLPQPTSPPRLCSAAAVGARDHVAVLPASWSSPISLCPSAERSGRGAFLPHPPSALHSWAAARSFASPAGWKVRLMVLSPHPQLPAPPRLSAAQLLGVARNHVAALPTSPLCQLALAHPPAARALQPYLCGEQTLTSPFTLTFAVSRPTRAGR